MQRIHKSFGIVWSLVIPIVITLAVFGATNTCWSQQAAPEPLSTEHRNDFDDAVAELDVALQNLPQEADKVAAAIFAKGIRWALQYDREFSHADVDLLKKAVSRGLSRANELKNGTASWQSRLGKLALGYISKIDQSVQPYGLIVPKGYDKSRPIRLDVVLHGSTRPVGLSELRFMSRFDEGDGENASPPNQPYIELHPLGRVENCYRWAGETDVFEAIEDVCKRYNIDRGRIVLRGMSMGASGTWHLGLKYPDRFVALGPYCGYVDTHRFSETPLPNFVKVGLLPVHQELALHMLDSVDYAANAGVVPAIACMGEKDVFFDAHVIMGQAFQREGLKFVNLISPGTGHVIDPVTHAEQMKQIETHVEHGLNRKPRDIRFVTWTLKYSHCHWLQILGLQQHYARAEFSGKLNDRVLEIAEPKNITKFSIQISQLPVMPTAIRVGTKEFKLEGSPIAESGRVFVTLNNGSWLISNDPGVMPNENAKRPGLQGPIDDAFTTPFLCVRGTGTAWNPAVGAYGDASLKRFAEEWRHYFRGELLVKDDTAVTDEDLKTKNLILFGDPGSNQCIAKALPHLPMKWTEKQLRISGKEYDSAVHTPAFIAPNPLAGATGRYVVVNSGHSFHEAELSKLNYLLFPRWGDWAVLEIERNPTGKAILKEEVRDAGYFEENWK